MRIKILGKPNSPQIAQDRAGEHRRPSSSAKVVKEPVPRTELAEIGARLAINIKAWRLERGMTQKDIARQLGVSYVLIHKFENGDVRVPIQRLIQLSRALRVPVAALLVGVSPELDDAAQLADPATVRLIRAFANVDSLKARESIVEGVEQIAAQTLSSNNVSQRARARTQALGPKRRSDAVASSPSPRSRR